MVFGCVSLAKVWWWFWVERFDGGLFVKVSLVVDFGCASLVVVLIVKGFGCVREYGEGFGCVRRNLYCQSHK